MAPIFGKNQFKTKMIYWSFQIIVKPSNNLRKLICRQHKGLVSTKIHVQTNGNHANQSRNTI